MKLTVNGETREVPQAATVSDLLGLLGITAPRVAVEVNRAIVPRARHGEHRLAEGDAVEVVTFVGGG